MKTKLVKMIKSFREHRLALLRNSGEWEFPERIYIITESELNGLAKDHTPELSKALIGIIEGAKAYYIDEENDTIIMDRNLISKYEDIIKKSNPCKSLITTTQTS